MIDIDKLARESGASRGVVTGLDWWRFSPDELQLFVEKVMLAAQAAERDRAKECATEKPEPIECGWVAIVNGVLTNCWNNPDLPEGTHKLLAVRIDDE